MSERIYLDYNSSAPCRETVARRMAELSAGVFGNPSSAHREGREAKAVVEGAREQVAAALGADPMEIVFTSGGTEADNLAVFGVAEAATSKHPHVISSRIEHHAVLNACERLEHRGVRVSLAGCDELGRIDLVRLLAMADADAVLVSLMHANNEVGTIQPVAEVAMHCRERGVIVHTDAVQSMAKIPVSVKALGVDLLTISGHKIGGPKGVGALYVRKGTRMAPVMQGGHQEWDLRAGTENVAAIAGFGVAVAEAVREQPDECRRLQRLRGLFWAGLCAGVTGVVQNGDPDNGVPNTLNVSFDGVDGEAAMMALDLAGVAVSTGSACTVGAVETSHVLEAMCFERDRCRGAVRFSMGFGTTEDDIRRALEIIPPVIRRLRK